MVIGLSENNLAGFLTAIYHCYYTYKNIERITSYPNSCLLIDEVINIDTDIELARKVREGILKKVGQSGYRDINDAYLSSDMNKEQKIYMYLKLLFDKGKDIYTMYSCDAVIAFNDMVNKVRGEAHRMNGFIRFQEMDNGIFYSYYGSDNDILEIIIPHFVTRFNNQKFILHDVKRKKIAYYDGNTYHTAVVPDGVTIVLSDNEKIFSSLWKEYYLNVAIENRKNIKLQNHFVPKKYRFFMNEF